jgi:ElaB/YqjD/DUF883 family membrane-anchored ribosome-binding protein
VAIIGEGGEHGHVLRKIKPIMQETDMANDTTSTLLDESDDILQQTEQLLSEAVDATGEEAKALQARIMAGLRDARQCLTEAEQAVVAKAKTAAKATDSYVHENPWKAVGLGAAVGVVIGLLIARR